MKEHLANFPIAGLTYYDAVQCFDQFKIGMPLRLQMEQDNKYDARAVALYCGEHKIGFVPRAENRMIYKLLKLGHDPLLDCRIQQLDPTAHPENQVRVVVHLLPLQPTA